MDVNNVIVEIITPGFAFVTWEQHWRFEAKYRCCFNSGDRFATAYSIKCVEIVFGGGRRIHYQDTHLESADRERFLSVEQALLERGKTYNLLLEKIRDALAAQG